MNDDLQRRLDALANEATPSVDPVFADRLDSHLRSLAAEPVPTPFLQRLLRPSVLVVAAMAIAGAVFLVTRTAEPTQLEFAAATGTSVSIPGDIAVTDGAQGLLLPEGTRITVGPDGSAEVGGVILEPGTVAVVVNGVVEVVELAPVQTVQPVPTTAPAAPTTETTASETTVAPTTTTEPTASTDADADAVVEPDDGAATTTTSTPVAPTTSTTTTTQTPETTTTAAPTTTVPPEPTEPPSGERVQPSIALTITEGQNGQAVLTWTIEPTDVEVAGWVVRRGRGENSEVAAVLRRPEVRRQRVAVPDRNVAWQLVARDADGELIARSNIVRLN
jgi:hypothetical protein